MDIGAIDLGKEFMAAFACARYHRPNFSYSVQAKTKAVYQPTVKAEKELERRLDQATFRHTPGVLELESFGVVIVANKKDSVATGLSR